MFAAFTRAVRKGCFATAFILCLVLPVAAQPPDHGAPRLIHGPASRPLHLIPPLLPPQDHHEIPLRLVPPGTLLYGPAAGNTLWADLANDPDLGPCATTNDGDPIVHYDQLAGRRVMSQISFNSSAGYYVCIAVSQSDQAVSAGALGAWNRYAVIWNSTLPDYAKMSFWPNAYLLTANMYVNLGSLDGFFGRAGGCERIGIERTPLLASPQGGE